MLDAKEIVHLCDKCFPTNLDVEELTIGVLECPCDICGIPMGVATTNIDVEYHVFRVSDWQRYVKADKTTV
jgi:hypothetical protein